MLNAPRIHELDPPPEPPTVARRAASLPYTLWLDSALVTREIGRYSFLAIDPFRVLRSRRGRAKILDPDGWRPGERPPLAELERLLERYRLQEPADGLPFQGGAAGYFGYELGRQLEAIPRTRWREPDTPELEIAFYDTVVGWDHASGRAWTVSTGRPATGGDAGSRARERAEEIVAWLDGDARLEPQLPAERATAPGDSDGAGRGGDAAPVDAGGAGTADAAAERAGSDGRAADGPPSLPVPDHPDLRSTFSPQGYEAAVARAVEYIRDGDIFQVNLSQRFHARREASFDLYRRLRVRNPAPFSAFMTTPACTVASSSPERFLRVDAGGRVETRPIKGTRARGRNPLHDMYLESELAESEKDRAENLMIVDLLRNDLSRVCRPSSIRVPRLFRRESYATVHHLVSIVTGRLEEGRGPVDLLRAAFPGGSVTGAPKIRAMEIIAELEPVPRGPYCGSVGYLGFDGTMDTSITIRTLVGVGDDLYFHAGGAVVADSDPRREYLETLDKAEGLIRALPAEDRSGERPEPISADDEGGGADHPSVVGPERDGD